jgi:tetratricopeptide (TPR) repeat protein
VNESYFSMNVRTESASPTATEMVLQRLAALEAEGFVRPRSLSADAYFTALAELDPAWAADLAILAGSYAESRFGGGKLAFDRPSIAAASQRIADRTEGLNRSGEMAPLREAWQNRFAIPTEPTEATPQFSADAVATPALAAAANVQLASSRSGAGWFDLSRLRFLDPEELSRRVSRTSVSLGSAAGALVVAAALASLGTVYFPEGVRMIRSAFDSVPGDETIALPGAPIALVSPGPVSLSVAEATEPTWPRLYPATHPQADDFNDVIAESLSKLARLYCEIGRPERAAAIYSYVADARPQDDVAQLEYADYLLNPDNPAHRDPDRACLHAERAYELNPSDLHAVETLTAALCAAGDLARAAEIQQEWLDRERQSGIALKAEDRPASARSAG